MKYVIKNASIVNENEIVCFDLLIENGIIARIDRSIGVAGAKDANLRH